MDANIERNMCFSIRGMRYAAFVDQSLPVLSSSQGLYSNPALTTVIPVLRRITADWLLDFEAAALTPDDVFVPDFLATVLFQTSSNEQPSVEKEASLLMQRWGTRDHHFVSPESIASLGPHLMIDGCVFPVYRLQNDTARAFVISLRHDANAVGG